MSLLNQSRWDIKKSVIISNIFHLFYFSGKTCLIPFMTLYFKQIGMSGTQVGLLLACKSIIWYFTVPIWIAIAKRCDKTKCILMYALFSSILSSLFISLLPNMSKDININCSIPKTGFMNQSLILDNSSTYTLPIPTSQHPNPTLPSTTSSSITFTNLKSQTKKPSITTTSNLVTSKKQISNHQLAVKLLSEFMETNPKSRKEMDKFLSKNPQTNKLSPWKLKSIYNQMLKIMIKSYPDFKFSEDQETSSTILMTTTTKNSITKSSTTALNKDDETQKVERVVDKLMNYKEKKYPYHTIDEFLDIVSRTSPISTSLRKKIKKMMLKKMAEAKSDEGRPRRSINMSLISNNISQAVKTSYHVVAHQVSEVFDDVLTRTLNNSNAFIWVFVIIIIGEILSSGIEALSDNSLYELLEELDSLNHYGKHKTYSLIGTILMGFPISLLVHISPCQLSKTFYSYNLHFYGFIFLVGISFFLVPCYPVYSSRRAKENRMTSPLSCFVCCLDCRHFIFMMTSFIAGIVQSALNNFLFWEIEKMSSSSYLVFGTIISVSGLLQLLIQSWGRKFVPIIRVYLSGSIALMLIAIQLLTISFVKNAWLAAFVQLLNVAGQTFLWSVINFHVNMRMFLSWNQSSQKGLQKRVRVFAKTAHQRNMQNTLVSLYQGLAFAFGSLISGISYDISDNTLVPFLRGSSVVVFIWVFVFIFFTFMCNVKSRRFNNLLDSDDEEQQLFSFENRNKRQKKRSYVRNHRNGSRKYNFSTSSSSSMESDNEDWLETAIKEDASKTKK